MLHNSIRDLLCLDDNVRGLDVALSIISHATEWLQA
jgi:hypothetical protein